MARSSKKGPFVDSYLLKKVEDQDKAHKKEVIKTWSRRSTIYPSFVQRDAGFPDIPEVKMCPKEGCQAVLCQEAENRVHPFLRRPVAVKTGQIYPIGNPFDRVKIIHGPLEGTEGTIVTFDKESGSVRVQTIFFGRPTVVDVDFSEIDRI